MLELALVFLIFGGLGIILLSMNWLLGPSRTNPSKEQPFECGSPYLQKGINPFPVNFYLVAFIIEIRINKTCFGRLGHFEIFLQNFWFKGYLLRPRKGKQVLCLNAVQNQAKCFL